MAEDLIIYGDDNIEGNGSVSIEVEEAIALIRAESDRQSSSETINNYNEDLSLASTNVVVEEWSETAKKKVQITYYAETVTGGTQLYVDAAQIIEL